MLGEKRPIINVDTTTLERIYNLISIVLLCASFVYVIYIQKGLHAEIPIHFGKGGKPNGWGSGKSLFIVPAIAVAMFIFLYIISKRPHWHNIPVEVTEENARFLYPLFKEAMAGFNCVIIIGFSILTWEIVQSAILERGDFLGPTLFMVFVPLAYIGYNTLSIWQKYREWQKNQ